MTMGTTMGRYPFSWDGGWHPDEPYDKPGESEDWLAEK